MNSYTTIDFRLDSPETAGEFARKRGRTKLKETGLTRTVVMVGVMVVWASFYPIIKITVADVDPLALSFLRYFFALIPLTPYALYDLRRKGSRPGFADSVSMGLLGVAGISAFAVFLFYGIKLSTAVNGALLTNTQPVFTAILGPILLAEVFTARRGVGVLIGLGGMALVVTGGDLSRLAGGGSAVLGNVLLLGASFSLSLYSVLIKKYVIRYGIVIPTWISMGVGTIVIAMINLIRHEPSFILAEMNPMSVFLIVYLGVIGTSLTYLLFNRMLLHMDVVAAISYKMLIPVFGLVLSVLFLAERPGIPTLVGVGIVLVALGVVQYVPRHARG